MALFLKQDEERSEIQKRIATELQEKAKRKMEEAELPDGVGDSQYIKGTKQTTSLAWVWVTIVVVFVAITFWLMSKA